MLVQNTSSTAPAPAPKLAGDSIPVAVAAPKTRDIPVDQQHGAAKAVPEQRNVAPPTPAQVQNAVDSINKAMKQVNANVEFSIDEDTRKTIIKVVESETGEVIRQFPSEEILAIARAIDNMQQGFLVKQEA